MKQRKVMEGDSNV